MKYQNFIMRILCLLLILAAVVGYNSMQKKDTQAQESQEIEALSKRVEKLEEQNTEMLSALEEAAKNQEAAIAQAQNDEKDNTAKDDAEKADTEKADTADAEESDDAENVYKDGSYTGSAQGFGGAITVQVTLKNDEITDIQVTSAPGEDSAYLSQGEGVISSIISAQSTDVDTVSGATFSSTGIINAVVDALGKAEN